MKSALKLLSVFILLSILMAGAVAPVRAFDGRAGETVTIESGEVIEDDVYVTAGVFVLDGTIKGDLVVSGGEITINGIIEGDLIAAGQTIVINGSVTDDARIAGAALLVSENAIIGGDLVAAGASLETQGGSSVQGELAAGAGQMLLAGKIEGDAIIGAGALDLRGEFGGDVTAEVGDAAEGGHSFSPNDFMPGIGISVPSVPAGLSIDKNAKIKGDFEYTQLKDIDVPSGVVEGKTTRKEPVIDPAFVKEKPTFAEMAVVWALELFRLISTIFLVGLALGWLAPNLLRALMDKAKENPAASLGWGVVSYAGFFFAILVIVVATIVLAIVFGVLTLGEISGSIIWIGITALLGLIVGFAFTADVVTKIIVAWLGGKLILNRIKPELADHKVWSLAVGAVTIGLAISLPFVGWLFGIVVVLLGLGACWLWAREMWEKRKTVTQSA